MARLSTLMTVLIINRLKASSIAGTVFDGQNSFLKKMSSSFVVVVRGFCSLACWDVSNFEKQKPFREWRVHSLSVRAVCSTRCGEQRVVSCSLDHTAAIHSIAHDYCLLKVCSCIIIAVLSVIVGESYVEYSFCR